MAPLLLQSIECQFAQSSEFNCQFDGFMTFADGDSFFPAAFALFDDVSTFLSLFQPKLKMNRV